jgi:hypothetical protein
LISSAASAALFKLKLAAEGLLASTMPVVTEFRLSDPYLKLKFPVFLIMFENL